MTQEKKDCLQYMIDVMQAYKDGKEIECKRLDISWDEWSFVRTPVWDWVRCDYRVKPEPPKPKYCPFENAEEAMEAIKKHGNWITLNGRYYLIIEVTNTMIVNGSARIGMTFKDALDAAFLDDTPFGKLIEE